MADDEGITVTFYVQSDSAVPERRRKIVSQLADLDAEEAIGSYSCEYWPKAVCLDELEGRKEDEVVEAYNDIREWAESEGASVSPPFDVRTYQWEVTGGRDKRLHTPHMGLAIFEQGEIREFYPHRSEESIHTVGDGIERLKKGIEERREQVETTETTIESER